MSRLGFHDPDKPTEGEGEAAGEAAPSGLPGAPVRTPIRESGARTGLELWPAIAGRVLTRQVWIELYGVPGYSLTLAPPRAKAFAAAPRDFRPHDPGVGRSVLSGRWVLAGLSLDVEPPADPWSRPSPSRPFAVELHNYDWLPSLMLNGERGAREAMRLILAWTEHFLRWSPFAWDPDILGRRVFNLACAARRLAAAGTEAERGRLADLLGRQARQLLRPPGGLVGRAERLTAAAIAGCALSGPGKGIRRTALSRLSRVLPTTVLPDGGHATRSPEAGLELLLDLLTLEDALAQIAEPVPDAVTRAIDALGRALRVLTLPDGRLASFEGGGPSTAARVAAARAHGDALDAATQDRFGGMDADLRREGPGSVGGLFRIASPLMTVVADAATPAQDAWSTAACAQPAALEIVCGRDRMITNSGWTPRASDRQALRLTPAGSTLALGDASLGEPLGGWKGELLGPRLVGADLAVEVQHREAESAVWLDIEHSGWAPRYGLKHQRRLYLDQRLDELRAEERLHPASDKPDHVRAIAAPYAVRFHLEPGVSASLARDRRSILLRGHSGRGWWFRTDGPDVAIEPSVHVDDGLTRRSLQIVVRGSARTDAETKIRWKLSPAGAGGDAG